VTTSVLILFDAPQGMCINFLYYGLLMMFIRCSMNLIEWNGSRTKLEVDINQSGP